MLFPQIFSSTNHFHSAFVSGLEDMLHHEGLGVFILVLANATYDEEIYRALRGVITERYASLASTFDENMDDAPDDIQVFRQLMDVGLDKLHLREMRSLGPWNVQFNQLRSFRPTRISENKMHSLLEAFNPQGFHFNKPFLKKEILWEGELGEHQVRLLYNKFPFADYHGILVIEPAEERPQFLDEQVHHYIWKLTAALKDAMPGLGFGYNAYGAGASVNQQHFQMYMRDDAGYPIENPIWCHNAGCNRYPMFCMTVDNASEAWEKILLLHESNTAYNLLYRPGKLYIVSRRLQGHFKMADWITGMGWADMMGEVTAFRREDYENMRQSELEAEFRNASFDDLE